MRLPAGGRSVSIPRDARGHFQTDARIDGQRIDFMVDTGAQGAVVFDSPFVDAHGPLEKLSPRLDVVSFGLGGESKMSVARVPGVSLGGFDLKSVVVEHDGGELLGGGGVALRRRRVSRTLGTA